MKDKVLAYTYNYIDVRGCDTYVCVCFEFWSTVYVCVQG